MATTIWDLLNFVEKETGKKFIISWHKKAKPDKNGKKGGQKWYDHWRATHSPKKPKFFSNRPFTPKKEVRRIGYNLEPTERFLRLDLELPDHSLTPSQEERELCVEWAKEQHAQGVLHTPHGTHVYFLLKEFNFSDAEQIIKHLFSTYTGSYIVCDASWAETNWSQTGEFSNYTLSLYNTHTFNNYIYEANRYDKETDLTTEESSSYKEFIYSPRKTVRIGGSRQCNNEEFSQACSRFLKGESVDSIASSLQFHTKNELLYGLSKYNITRTTPLRSQKRPTASFKDKLDTYPSEDYIGNYAPSRALQRSFSAFAHIAHSISELAVLSDEDAFECLELPKFKAIKTFIQAKIGNDWQSFVKKTLMDLRVKYDGKLGQYTVSPVLIDQAIDFIKKHPKFTMSEVKDYLTSKAIRRHKYQKLGTSRAHIQRLLHILTESGSIKLYKKGRSSYYELYEINRERILECNFVKFLVITPNNQQSARKENTENSPDNKEIVTKDKYIGVAKEFGDSVSNPRSGNLDNLFKDTKETPSDCIRYTSIERKESLRTMVSGAGQVGENRLRVEEIFERIKTEAKT